MSVTNGIAHPCKFYIDQKQVGLYLQQALFRILVHNYGLFSLLLHNPEICWAFTVNV